MASIGTGLAFTLVFETLAYFGAYTFPTGLTVAGASLVLSILVFFGVSAVTTDGSGDAIDEDVRLVMEV